MKKIILVLIGFVTSSLYAQTSSIATWKDNAQGAYNIIHDDYGDVGVDGIWKYADTIASNRGIKFTIGAESGPGQQRTYVNVNGHNGPMEYAKNVMMPLHGHELIAHSHSHLCAVGNAGWSPCDMAVGDGWGEQPTSAEFALQIDSCTKFLEQLTGHKPQFYIFPYDRFTNAANDHLKALGYIGSRTGWTSHINEYYPTQGYDSYDQATIAPDADGFFRTAVMVKTLKTGSDVVAIELDQWAQYAIDNGVWVNRETHNVGTSGWGRIGVADYRSHLNFVQSKMISGELFVGTVSEILTYQMQKLKYTPTAAYVSADNKIDVSWNTPSFDVAAYLAPLNFKSPITLNVDIAQMGTLAGIIVKQGGVTKTFTLDGTTLSTNIYPHEGAVNITTTSQPCTTVCIDNELTATNATLLEGDALSLSLVVSGQGTLTYTWYKDGNVITNTGNSLTISSVTASDAGNYYVVVANGTNTETSQTVAVTVTVPPQDPYGGTRHAIPGIIENWKYDTGGAEVAYHDNEVANQSNSTIRNDQVDVGLCNDAASTYAIGYNNAGDWLEYSVTVQTAGTYKMEARVTSNESTGKFIIQDNLGANISTEKIVNSTGGWDNWQTITTANFHLDAGDQIIRFYVSSQYFDICTMNYILVQADASSTVDFTVNETAVCLGNPVTFTDASSTGTTYAWDFAGQAMTGQGPHNVTFTTAGQKTITLTVDGIVKTYTNMVTVNALPTVTANTTLTEVCLGGNVTLTGSGATTYAWDNAVTDGTATNPIATTTYTVTGTDANNCANTATTTVTVNALPTVTANTTLAEVCAGENVTLSGSGATTYAWDNAVTDGTAITPTGTKTYTVTGTDANNCTNTATTTVTVNALPTVTANTTLAEVCAGGDVTLSGSGANTYAWDNAVTDGTAITPTATKTYTVTGTGANNCVNTATTTVTVNALPTVTANTTLAEVCIGGDVTLSGSGANTYAWDNAVTDGTAITPTATKTYTVTGTGANNCVNTATTTVTVNALPTVTANTTLAEVCIGGDVTLSGSGATTYAWDNAVTDGTAITPTATKTYTVTGTDANNCTNTATTTVTVNALPTVVANTTLAEVCAGENVTLSGSGATTYAWDNAVTDGTAITPTATKTYTVTGTDANICTNTATTTVTVNALPTVVANTTLAEVCAGENVTLSGSGATTYAWDNAVTDGTAITPTATKTYTVTGTDANICTNTATTTVTVNTLPAAELTGTATICSSGSTNLAITLTGTQPWEVVYNDPTTGNQTIYPTSSSATVSVNNVGDYTLVSVKDNNNCVGTVSGTSTVTNFEKVIASGSTVCNSTPLSVLGGVSLSTTQYQVVVTVTQGDLVSTAVTAQGVTFTRDGTTNKWYSGAIDEINSVDVHITDANDCDGGVDIIGLQTQCSCPITATSLLSSSSICDDGTSTTTLTVNVASNNVAGMSDYSIAVTGAETKNTTETPNVAGEVTKNFTVNTNGVYMINVTSNGQLCSVNAGSTLLTVNPLPTVSVTGEDEICTGEAVTLAGNGATSYTWDNAVTDGMAFTPTATKTYTVTGTDANNCTNTATKTVTLKALPTFTVVNPTAQCGGTIDLTTTVSGETSGAVLGYYSNATATTTTPSMVSSTGTTYLQATKDGCKSVIKSVVATIKTIPTVATTNPSAVCSPNTIDLSTGVVNSTTGSVLAYYSTSNATTPIGQSVTSSGTYYVKATKDACSSLEQEIVVAINATPSLSTTSPSAVCSPSTVDITSVTTDASNTTGTLTYWTDATATTTLSNPNAIIASGTYYIKKGQNGCSDITSVVVVVDLGAENVSAGNDVQSCKATASVTALTPTRGTGTWSKVSGTGTINTSNGTSVDITGLVSGQVLTLKWSVTTNNACAVQEDEITITRESSITPSVSIATGDNIVCNGETVEVILSHNLNSPTITWTKNATVVVGNATFTTVINNATNISATVVYDNCGVPTPITSNTLLITGTGIPLVNAGINQVICKEQTNTVWLAGQASNGTTVWSGGDGIFANENALATTYTPTQDELNAGTVTLKLTANNNVCPTGANTIEVKFDVCSGIAIQLEDEEVTVYPNPFTDELVIDLDLYQSSAISWKLFSVTGNVLLSEDNLHTNQLRINTSSLNSGVYVIQLQADEKVKNIKVVRK